jgi:ABC-2 type transport system ATP-binding protein
VRDLISELRDAGKTIVFSSHILSDVEALCDRVGILSKGRLVETGRLDEMLARRSSDLEIVVTNLAPDALEALAREGLDVSINPGGAHIRVADESEVEAALARVRVHGGRLISVNPTRSSLEDFFMREVATTEPEREYQANSRG